VVSPVVTPYAVVAAVPDPELPVLTIEELGILRGVEVEAGGRVVVTITPTYSGCPALSAIGDDIRAALADAGVSDVDVRTELSPPWTTDWMTDAAREKLAAAGIAPPGPVLMAISVRCPRCGSPDTRELSRFGATACQALWRCASCLEPFEHVKAH
jgi:ring-1,2-phenylacetyl-CoA epoxidase subunit PaaD